MAKKQIKVGIVAEYNPFHNGHIYHINTIKKMFENPKIIVAMSHKYTQRGEIPIINWKTRVFYAKKYGVSKFIKLDVNTSSQAAHIFAKKAVLKLNKYKIDFLAFGSETNDVNLFIKIAQKLKENSSEYNRLIKHFLKKSGLSFPRATNLALNNLLGYDINMPNDILGLEYVKTIINNNLSIIPISTQRTIGYHSNDVFESFASATKIRELVRNNQDVSEYTPVDFKRVKIQKKIEDYYPKFQKIVKSKTAKKISEYHLITEGMENLFKKNIEEKSYESFVEKCTSKRYTASRIKRSMLFVFLKKKKTSFR